MTDSSPTPKIVFNPEGNEPVDACIPNISPAERKKRMNFGILQLMITFGILTAMLAFGVDKLWRLPLYFMFAGGAVSIFQALDKTWVALAQRRVRRTSDKYERVTDSKEDAQIQRQARKVVIKGVSVALVLTALVMLIPWHPNDKPL